jgi:peptidyl-prolyl cis-trans isomerase D
MALMTKIRNNLGKLFAVLAVFFILYIFFDWGLDLTGRKGRGMMHSEIFGKVNGREISYRQFSELLRRATENQKKQEGRELDEETERQIRSQVWNQIVDEMLIGQEIERLSITVSDQEIRDIIMGPNPPDFLVQQFKDSTGTFRRDAYQNAMADPQNRQAWVQVEDMIRQQQKQLKLQRLLLANIEVSESEMKQLFIDRTIEMNADYVLFDVNRLVPDSAVTVTDEDLRMQYDTHPENFQTKAMRRLKYILFNQRASAADTALIESDAQRLLAQAKSGATDFMELARTYSEIPPTDVFFKHGELSRKKEAAVFSGRKGSILGPIRDDDGVHLIKILDQRQGSKEFVKASHILLRAVSGPDSVRVIQQARLLLAKARSGADFAKLASENSQDFASAMQGGELGWASREQWQKPFADAAFKAGVGSIVGPVRTSFGWHIIKVTGKDRREVKIIDLALKIKATSATIDSTSQQAQDFAYLAKDEGFEKAAENSKFQVHETAEFGNGMSISGIGYNDAATNFAFKNKLGEISEPITTNGGLIVVMVSKIREEGVRPLDEVKSAVNSMALREKKLEKIREQAEAFYKTLTPASNLITAAQSMQNVMARNTGMFKCKDAVMGVGRDLKFNGTALSLKSGEISKPVKGNNGYYIIKLLSRTEFDSVKYKTDRETLRMQLLQERRQRMMADWHTALREKAEIIDNRDKYYR